MEFMVGIAFLLCVATALILLVGVYNALISNRENIEKAWFNIDVILKQRYDEIPQLIRICEQYITFEKSIVNQIMSAREKMIQGRTPNEKAAGFNDLSVGINGLFAVGESYPELKANANFMQIQSRLSSLEEALADRRELYNDSVNVYNIRIQSFPDFFVARILGYQRIQMFEIKDSERVAPDLTIKT